MEKLAKKKKNEEELDSAVQEMPNSFEDKSVLSGVTTDAEAASAEQDAN